MKKQYVLAIILFGSLWGAAEAVLGEVFQQNNTPLPAVWLAVIAVILLTIARAYCPKPGSAVLIAAIAMLFKFTNAPFFACHLLGVLMLGVGYEIAAAVFLRDSLHRRLRGAEQVLCGLAATYLGFALFAVVITYVIHYSYWDSSRAFAHIFQSGTIAALANMAALPLAAGFAAAMKAKKLPAPGPSKMAATGISLFIAALWIANLAISL